MPLFDAWLQDPDRDLPPAAAPKIADDTLPPAVVLRRRTREPRGRSRRRTAVAYDWTVSAWRAHEEVLRLRRTGERVPDQLAERAARVAVPEPTEEPEDRPREDLGAAHTESDQRRVLRALAHRVVRKQAR